MFAKFFIDRPIFAAVISLVITLAGWLAMRILPLSQYPQVTPPTVQIDCSYPGANSRLVADTIAAPIEQRVNGIENMLYMTSQSTSDGTYSLSATFEVGTDLNLAQVLMQNRVNQAMPELPDVVRTTGVTVRKRSPELLMTVGVTSPNGRYDQLYLSNYALTRLRDELVRIPGISDVTIFGQKDYSMRLWVNPEKLAARDLTALDVVNAVRAQNAQVTLGHLGAASDDHPTSVPLTVVGRLGTEDEFRNVVVKAMPGGQLVRVKDVATVELGAKNMDVANQFDGKPTIGLSVFLLPGANALETGDAIKAKMQELSQDFPAGAVGYEVAYDTTPFIRESIDEVKKSLLHSVLLVAVVVLVFLQSWRAAVIPLAAVPVAIVGTFAAMWVVGFGLNHLTLFGLVLSVGIVVDDAIVVVEAVQHQMEKGLPPRAATVAAMADVSGPIIAVGVVLAAVFIPCAFFTGIVGQFFRQFALTIAISSIISTINSLTLSPALAAILLRPRHRRPDVPTRVLNLTLGWLFWLFNRGFDLGGRGYVRAVGGLIRVPVLVAIVYAGTLAFTGWVYTGMPADPRLPAPVQQAVKAARPHLQLPIGFIPTQDQGRLMASIQLPEAAAAGRTQAAVDKLTKAVLSTPGVAHVTSVAGNSFVVQAYGSNFGSMFIVLDPFDQRRTPELYADAIAATLRKKLAAAVPEAQVSVFGSPAVSGLGRTGGFRMMVEDRGDLGPLALQAQTEGLIDFGNDQPGLVGLFTVFNNDSPQVVVKVNTAECVAQGIDVRDVYATMQASLGSRYVNDFNRFGRTWQVNVQADPRFRNTVDDVSRLKVRTAAGKMVPLAAVAEVKEMTGPLVVTRFNMYPAAAVNGNSVPGTSSGEALAVMEQIADRTLPPGMAVEWADLSFLEKRARSTTVPLGVANVPVNTTVAVFGFSVLVVFLVLAFLYESWAFPLAVILVVPTCVSCSLLGVGLSGQDVNVFTQIGFVVLIGLACKNAILVVEYAKRRREAGADRRAAILEACRLRLRPILMTSVAFILGVSPLLVATGAGAEMRRALGTAVFSGMLGVTLFGVFLTPVFFVLVDRLTSLPVFRNRWMRRASTSLRYVLALGFVAPLVRLTGKVIRRP